MKPALIVLGATGAVGRGVVTAALEARRPVIAIARDDEALDALQTIHAGSPLSTLAASVSSDAEAAALSTRLRGLDRPFAGVVAAMRGDIERGRLLDAPDDLLRRRLDEDLLPHLFAARHLLPLLADSHGERTGRPGYVLIGGPGAEHPWAGYGHYSVAAASLRMLARVLHDEAHALAVRVQMLAVDAPVRTDDNARHACSSWPGVDAIARHALAMVGGAEPPTDVIVRHAMAAARAQPPAPARNGRVTTTPAGSSDRQDAADAGSGAQDADGTTDPAVQRSLHDARHLLRAITGSSGPAFPHFLETPPS